jgi:glycosyltransferase involved in cell wall biosynthesis
VSIQLTYFITTFNKLHYLQVTLPLLIAAKHKDEEIIVVDGGSTDGTPAYLKRLEKEGQIDVLLSEPDKGEAHGINKAMLLARGQIIKIITDDDVFDYHVIRHCRKFMLDHPAIDLIAYDGYGCLLAKEPVYTRTGYIEGFRKWKKDQTPFLFCGLSMMIRRASLSYIGLLSTQHRIVDMEYSLRVSSLQTKIAYYTGPGFINIVNPDSNSQKFYSAIRDEKKRLQKIYPSVSDNFRISDPVLLLKEQLSRLRRPGRQQAKSKNTFEHYETLVKQGLQKLHQENKPLHSIIK